MRQAPAWVARLALAADAFLFARPLPSVPDGQSVIAGYPWFGDWGRDTMISLPGLTLATGRPQVAHRILKTFASFVSQGMLPNVFPGAGDRPEYNTADASLWFFEAWRAYFDATADVAAMREAFPVLSDMIEWHRKGTRYGIAVDPADGLLKAGVAGRAADVDGCEGRRLGGHAAHRQAGRNQCAVAQRAAHHERVRHPPGTAGSFRRARRTPPSAALRDSCARTAKVCTT